MKKNVMQIGDMEHFLCEKRENKQRDEKFTSEILWEYCMLVLKSSFEEGPIELVYLFTHVQVFGAMNSPILCIH
ncbi:hypothetical protein L2E82_01973 [Cichorium intybus]|uniref:Uncharacterized protein n=1 Tax=Cichorium intybus TaxID=13427 RepID=A0ACB9H1G1_CICIN|nr:hypothetical protein L2E82_01973 [Cichorium intybus]